MKLHVFFRVVCGLLCSLLLACGTGLRQKADGSETGPSSARLSSIGLPKSSPVVSTYSAPGVTMQKASFSGDLKDPIVYRTTQGQEYKIYLPNPEQSPLRLIDSNGPIPGDAGSEGAVFEARDYTMSWGRVAWQWTSSVGFDVLDRKLTSVPGDVPDSFVFRVVLPPEWKLVPALPQQAHQPAELDGHSAMFIYDEPNARPVVGFSFSYSPPEAGCLRYAKPRKPLRVTLSEDSFTVFRPEAFSYQCGFALVDWKDFTASGWK